MNLVPTVGAVLIALAALAAIVVVGIHGTITGEAVSGLLGSIVTGGFALAAHASGAAQAAKTIRAAQDR